MKKKLRTIFLSLAVSIAVLFTILWIVIECIVIPKVVVPKIDVYIKENIQGDVKLDIADISFHPLKGFLFKDVTLTGPVHLKNTRILHASLIDIDLALAPLVFKRIEVVLFKMSGVDLNVGRDNKGKWNFAPLANLGFMSSDDSQTGEGKKGSGFTFLIKKLKTENASINYTDYMQKNNVLERKITNIKIDLISPRKQVYKLSLSGGDQDRKKEAVDVKILYNKEKKSVQGMAEFNTAFVSDYWDYYLDDIFKPWRLQADGIGIKADFSLKKDTLCLDGIYTIDNGILDYGDLSIKCNAKVTQKLKYVEGVPAKDITRIDLYLENVSSLTGEYVFLDKGQCTAVITEKAITIERLSGVMKKQPLYYSGKFTFIEPRELHLTGKIANIDNSFNLMLLSDNQGTADWQGNIENSYIKLHADIDDLKDLMFNLNVDGNIQLPDLSKLLTVDKDKFRGEIDISGNIKGEVDEASSLQGGMVTKVKDFSFWNLEPLSLEFDMDIENGIFRGNIPRTDFYKGSLYGAMQIDFNKWGIELHMDKFDIAEFVKTDHELEGMKGIFTGNIACVSKWADFSTVKGGGYFKLNNCDLWGAPIFSDTKEGIESVTTDIDMPDFKKLEGNFEVKEESIYINNTFAKTSGMNLKIQGKYSFSGMADFTVGARLLGEGLFRTARHILLPVTIGIDLVANCIQVKIDGKWPDLEQKTQIRPIGWLTAIFPSGRAYPNKYSLKKLWSDSAF